MKFGQLIEYDKRNTFLQKSYRKWAGRLDPCLFLFKKSFIQSKSKWSAAQYISIALKVAYNKNKLYKNLDYWSRDVLNFEFLQKGLGVVSPTHFVYDLSRKVFLMLYPINWPNFIVWFPLLLEILSNMCIAIVCFPGCHVINFVFNLIFLIKLFFCFTKNSGQIFKYLENEISL